LIVEDNIVNQKVLSKQLRSAGCTVHVANHGGEALSFLSKTRFWAGNENNGLLLHIILMDLEMPVMNGLTCVKRIRELQKEGVITRHVPVIAVTANARSEQIATAKESGMDSVVTKPFRIPELLPEMERQVRRGEGRPVELERSSFAPD
jgi:CheY-like chemotaxis protein